MYLFLGSVSGEGAGVTGAFNPLTIANASMFGDSGAAVGAQVVPLGDVNGGGIASSPLPVAMRRKTCTGARSGWSMGMTADVRLSGYSPAPNKFIAAVGDVNVDGLNDILLGATGGGGRAYLVLGRRSRAPTNRCKRRSAA